MKSKAFTLIELITVLVILAILALIVTPLVLNIIKKARISADKRSVDLYGKNIEIAIAEYLLRTGKFPCDVNNLKIEYKGKKVSCEIEQLNEDASIYLSKCKVGNNEVKDLNTEDGYYHYGNLNAKSYKRGDIVTYNDVDFYVIKNDDNIVKLLKKDPLATEEVNTYGAGHVNMYNTDSNDEAYHKAKDINGYGAMSYYTSKDCGYGTDSNKKFSGCKNDYESSDVKVVIDNWAKDIFKNVEVQVRLLTLEEIVNDLKFEVSQGGCATCSLRYVPTSDTPLWSYKNDYKYWTMTPVEDSFDSVFRLNSGAQYEDGYWYDPPLEKATVHSTAYTYIDQERTRIIKLGFMIESTIRPVVEISKSAIGSTYRCN